MILEVIDADESWSSSSFTLIPLAWDLGCTCNRMFHVRLTVAIAESLSLKYSCSRSTGCKAIVSSEHSSPMDPGWGINTYLRNLVSHSFYGCNGVQKFVITGDDGVWRPRNEDDCESCI